MCESAISKKLGIVGGGQLGKMMILEAAKMGIYTIVLDPDEDCPAKNLANDYINASFDDKNALLELAEKADILTCEFEHISTKALLFLEKLGYTIYPGSEVLMTIQNKYLQKLELQKNYIPVGEFMKVQGIESIYNAVQEFGYPIMLKSILGGYDGKGNCLIRCEEDIVTAYHKLQGDVNPLYAERFIPYKKEVSVLCCNSMNGEMKVYPIAENVHIDSILFETSVPANISEEVKNNAHEIAKQISKIFKTAGILCVEMFITQDNKILVNEVAPRPHNSGHYTIEGCITSQFENHVRAVLGLPLGNTDLIKPTVMRNILGEEGYEGKPDIIGAEDVLKINGASLHIYGKKYTKYQRKMGHLSITADTLEEASRKAEEAGSFIKIITKDGREI